MKGPIVVGFDGSACSCEALTTAIELARDMHGELLIVCCRDVPVGLSWELDPSSPAARELRDAEATIEQELEPLLDEAADQARRADVPVETHVEWGECVAALRRVATERKARLVVVGSHCEGMVSALLTGSPCHRLVFTCPRPVLVVPHGKGPRKGVRGEQRLASRAAS
jgi:nucleotide-binding universal stress UspA family protein